MGTDGGSRIVTVPNVISLARLACAPVFVWLLADDDLLAAAVLLAVLGATDWVDGWIARHFDQGSELGKVLDPVADRILLLVAAVALIVQGSVPARGRRAGARPRGWSSASRCSCSRPPAPAASTCSGSGKRARSR